MREETSLWLMLFSLFFILKAINTDDNFTLLYTKYKLVPYFCHYNSSSNQRNKSKRTKDLCVYLNWVIAGIFSATAALMRHDGAELLVVLFPWLIFSFLFCKNERKNILKRIITILIVILEFFALAVYPVQTYFNRNGSYYTVILNSKTLIKSAVFCSF